MRAHQCDKHAWRNWDLTEQWERIPEMLSAQELTSAAARARRIDQPTEASSHLLLSHFLPD
jgi:hypothetical protein